MQLCWTSASSYVEPVYAVMSASGCSNVGPVNADMSQSGQCIQGAVLLGIIGGWELRPELY